MKIKVLCASAALVIAPVAIAEELSDAGEFLDGVAAIVNEGVVLKSQYRNQLDAITRRAEEQRMELPPPEVLEDQVLERLILNEIQLQRADRIGLAQQISDQVVNAAMQRIADQSSIPITELPAQLAKDGISYPQFRRELRDEIMLNELKRIEVMRSIRVSEREVEQCILDLETNVVVNSDWQLSHILLTINESSNAEEVAAIELIADQINTRLQDGADFRELAARFSGGSTALEGGSLGWMQGQQIPSIFTEVLQDMKAGDISEPFRTSNSIHIVKVDDLRSAVERSEVNQIKIRHILIMPNEIIDDATAKQRLDDVLGKIRGGEDFGEQAKLLSDDPGSANLGGDLGWAMSSDYAPEFSATAEAAEIGEISEPFRTQFGWHILEVLDRRVYDNTEEVKEQNCVVRIRNSKQEEETLLWLQRMRDEAFVQKRI
ncbi:MAG: peptidylprolyl isomerase [Gammaproteobacteria bacterium]|nr:peptidylprolyl isomerase [Gammaproteobacteria bacterium]